MRDCHHRERQVGRRSIETGVPELARFAGSARSGQRLCAGPRQAWRRRGLVRFSKAALSRRKRGSRWPPLNTPHTLLEVSLYRRSVNELRLFGEEVANFFEQDFLTRRRRWFGWCFLCLLLHIVHALDDHEHDKGDDQE